MSAVEFIIGAAVGIVFIAGCVALGTWIGRMGWHDHFERKGRHFRTMGYERWIAGERWVQRDFDRGYDA